jgi:hypothetical protein
MRSIIERSPTQSNGSEKCSSHIGLKPLFFTTVVECERDRADEEAEEEGKACDKGEGAALGVLFRVLLGEACRSRAVSLATAMPSGRNGEPVQSGTCRDTST